MSDHFYVLLQHRKCRGLMLQCSIVSGPTLSFLEHQNPRKQEHSPNKDAGIDFFHVPLNPTFHKSASPHRSPSDFNWSVAFPEQWFPSAHLGFSRTEAKFTKPPKNKKTSRLMDTHHEEWCSGWNLLYTNSCLTCLNVFLLDEAI